MVVFLLSSLFCALSDSLQMLTLARVIQGFGGAALMSVNTALIRLIYPQRFLGRGMGINSFIVAVSSAAGPTIAAAILSIASRKWLFLINVPLGIIAPASGDAFFCHPMVLAPVNPVSTCPAP
ncbi:MFS transporter [Escherichia coli]